MATADAITQYWVRITGRRFEPKVNSWLDGPIGEPDRIGEDFFERFASIRALTLRPGRGLLEDTSILLSSQERNRLDSGVARFYQETSRFDVDLWSEWSGSFRPFGALLARLFSRRLEQLNVPLGALDSSRGMTSEICEVVDNDARPEMTAWIRKLNATGRVVYCGAYSTIRLPGEDLACLKVVFPLPNGNATVVLRPSLRADGGLTLRSEGRGFGDPGFYFVVRTSSGWYARYLRAMQERIDVYSGDCGEVRTDHELRLWGATFLRLHYRLAERAAPARV
jgi:hypothetical protein